MMLISVEKVLVSSIAENGQKSIGDTHAIPQKLNYRDTRCDTEKTSKKYRRYQVLRYFIAILTALGGNVMFTFGSREHQPLYCQTIRAAETHFKKPRSFRFFKKN